jgi:hypothetical protein
MDLVHGWTGGHHGGAIHSYGDGKSYSIGFKVGKSRTSKTFSTEQCAKEYQAAESVRLGYTTNRYRLIDDDSVEMEVSGTSFFFDLEDLDTVSELKWTLQDTPKKVTNVTSHNGKRTITRLGNLLTGFTRVFYIDGDRLNNRRNNLSSTEPGVVTSQCGIPGWDTISLDPTPAGRCRQNLIRRNEGVIEVFVPEMKDPSSHHIARFDEDDYCFIESYELWCTRAPNRTKFKLCYGKKTSQHLHKLLCPDYAQVYHIDGDSLNLTRANLHNGPPPKTKAERRLCKCGKVPHYGFVGSKSVCCVSCKESGMISLTGLCPCTNTKRKRYGIRGSKATHCVLCKEDGMANISSAICEVKSCLLEPSYGFPGKKPVRCITHSLEGMENVKSPKCHCGKIACFSVKGNRPERCFEHSEPGMTNTRTTTICTHPACSTRASFGTTKPIHCKKHRLPNDTDLVTRLCPCGKVPHFGIPNTKTALACKYCKTKEMVDLRANRCKCSRKVVASFGYPNKRATCCKFCKRPNMKDTVSLKCPDCTDTDYPHQGCKKCRGYCSSCFSKRFPDDPVTRNLRKHVKEFTVRKYIDENFTDFTHNQPVCHHTEGRQRYVDHIWRHGNALLCVETDENQHRSYGFQNELDRYVDIHLNYGTEKRIIWLRFNVDYWYEKGKKKDMPLKERLPVLKEAIISLQERIKRDEDLIMCDVKALFYDDDE